MKLLITVTLAFTLTGCVSWMPMKVAMNQICGSSEDRKEELARKVDKELFPHSPRAGCFTQEKRDKSVSDGEM